MDVRAQAIRDPEGFIQGLTCPVLIDEAQYAPELFIYIKIAVDQNPQLKGQYWLTGSQQFSLMKGVSESLAGRVGILSMNGISLAEEEGRPQTPHFIPTPECMKYRQSIASIIPRKEIYQKIWRGSFPEVIQNERQWETFYTSYIRTYLERDVRDYLKIEDMISFHRFMQEAAARTGQMLNFRDIAKDVGVSEPTIKKWFQVLEATGLVTFVRPYFNNRNKRMLKTPKFYFMDTGLCCHLTKWSSAEVLEYGAMSGAILETYVVSEIIKSYLHHGKHPPIYYYADKDQREVDLLIEEAGHLHPIEIKRTASVFNSGFKGFDFLKSLKMPIGHGCLLCFTPEMQPFSRDIDIVPIGYL